MAEIQSELKRLGLAEDIERVIARKILPRLPETQRVSFIEQELKWVIDAKPSAESLEVLADRILTTIPLKQRMGLFGDVSIVLRHEPSVKAIETIAHALRKLSPKERSWQFRHDLFKTLRHRLTDDHWDFASAVISSLPKGAHKNLLGETLPKILEHAPATQVLRTVAEEIMPHVPKKNLLTFLRETLPAMLSSKPSAERVCGQWMAVRKKLLPLLSKKDMEYFYSADLPAVMKYNPSPEVLAVFGEKFISQMPRGSRNGLFHFANHLLEERPTPEELAYLGDHFTAKTSPKQRWFTIGWLGKEVLLRKRRQG